MGDHPDGSDSWAAAIWALDRALNYVFGSEFALYDIGRFAACLLLERSRERLPILNAKAAGEKKASLRGSLSMIRAQQVIRDLVLRDFCAFDVWDIQLR